MARPTADDIKIARAYRRAKNRGRSRVSMAALRTAELNRIFRARYGSVWPDDDAARDDFNVLAHHLGRHPDGRQRIREFAGDVAPWLEPDEIENLITIVQERPIRWTADKLAHRIGLTAAIRRELRIRTIGCVDMTKAQRAAEQRERRRAAQALRRRAAGAMTSAEYHAARRARLNSCRI